MVWVGYSLISAVLTTRANFDGKRVLSRLSPAAVAWARCVVALPVLLLALAVAGLPTAGPAFWGALAISVPLNVVAQMSLLRALSLGTVSAVMPLVCLLPPLILAVEWGVLGTAPSPLGLGGVALAVAGTYLVTLEPGDSPLAPLRRLTSPGPARWVLLAVLLWSVSAVADRAGIQASSPLGYLVALYLGLALGLLPFVRELRAPGRLWADRRLLLTGGVSLGGADWAQMCAFALAPAGYVVALRRLSDLLSVAVAQRALREQVPVRRWAGAAVLLLGVVAIGW